MANKAVAQRIGDSPYLPVVLFLGITFVGCIYVWFSKIYVGNVWIAISVPIMIMFGYLGISIIVGRLRVHDEQIGDNLYYMGFLFTLTSLGVSLYRFSADGEMDVVVQNFGVAITSTIVGIALRIAYNQARRDPGDVERAARHELVGMSRRVRAEMENVTLEFSEFRRICNQMLAEGYGEIVNQARLNGEQVRQAFDKMSSEAIQPVKETSERLADALDQSFSRIEDRFNGVLEKVSSVATLLEKANASFGQAVGRFETQADAVAGKLERLVIPDTVLKEEMLPVVRQLAESVGKHAGRTETITEEQAARTRELTDAVEKSISAANDRNETLSKILERAEEREKAFAEFTEKLAGKLDGIVSSVREHASAVRSSGSGIVEEKPLNGNGPSVADGERIPESTLPDTVPPTSGVSVVQTRQEGLFERLKGWRS